MAVHAYGSPLEPTDVAEPTLLPGHALLEVLTCGVCFSDVKTARGRMPFSDRLALPHVPGHEICARVIRTDPPEALVRGTTVVVYHLWPCRTCDRCRAGEDNLCRAPRGWTGFTDPGGFQDRVMAPLDRLVAVPAAIDPVHAAPLTCALGTAYRATITRGRLAPGMRVAVVGLGGVGIHALQIASAAGARAAGLDPSPQARDVAAELGLNAVDAADPAGEERLRAETAGEDFDVIIDTVGREATIAQAERLVRPGGRIVAVGYAVGTTIALPSARTVLEEVEFVGSRYVRRDELDRAIRLVADGSVRIVVDRVRPLEQANEAFTALESGDVVGRVVLDVAGVS